MKVAEFEVTKIERQFGKQDGKTHVLEAVIFERLDVPERDGVDPGHLRACSQFQLVDVRDLDGTGFDPAPLHPVRLGQRFALVLEPKDWEPKTPGEAARHQRVQTVHMLTAADEKLAELERRVRQLEGPVADLLRWHAEHMPIGSTGP